MAETLDLRGLKCPLPVLKARRALRHIAIGEVLEVLTTDPGAPQDFVHFCTTTGNELIEILEREESALIRLRHIAAK